MKEESDERSMERPWDWLTSGTSPVPESHVIDAGDSTVPDARLPGQGGSGVGGLIPDPDGVGTVGGMASSREPPDDDDWSIFDEPPRTSAKQIRANRENAKNSTGPRTSDWTAKSSQNALKHHIYRTEIAPIEDGSMAENPEEFLRKVDLLIDAMAPRDAMEFEYATRMAGPVIKLGRNDRWGALSIRDAALMRPSDFVAGARSAFGVLEVRMGLGKLLGYLTPGQGLGPASPPDFKGFAETILWNGLKPNVKVKGLWDETNTPSTTEEWRTAYETLKQHSWQDDPAAVEWLKIEILKMELRLETLDGMEERIAAKRILAGPFDLQTKYETRLLNNLKTSHRVQEISRNRSPKRSRGKSRSSRKGRVA